MLSLTSEAARNVAVSDNHFRFSHLYQSMNYSNEEVTM